MLDVLVQVKGCVMHASLALVSTNLLPCLPTDSVPASEWIPRPLGLPPSSKPHFYSLNKKRGNSLIMGLGHDGYSLGFIRIKSDVVGDFKSHFRFPFISPMSDG